MSRFIEIEDLNKNKNLVNVNWIIDIDKITNTSKPCTRIWFKSNHIEAGISEYDRILNILKSCGNILEEFKLEPAEVDIENEFIM